jgi:hypothetical protein
VAAEIIVVVDDENFGLWSSKLAIEICGCETADASANNDQIVRFGVVYWICPGFRIVTAIAQFVRYFPGTVVSAAKSGFCGRIIIRILLGSEGRLRDAEGFEPGGICSY